LIFEKFDLLKFELVWILKYFYLVQNKMDGRWRGPTVWKSLIIFFYSWPHYTIHFDFLQRCQAQKNIFGDFQTVSRRRNRNRLSINTEYWFFLNDRDVNLRIKCLRFSNWLVFYLKPYLLFIIIFFCYPCFWISYSFIESKWYIENDYKLVKF
jgi:hypothetical protein